MNEPSQENLSLLETCKILLFRSKNCKVPVSIGLNSSRMRQFTCVFDTRAGPKLVQANDLDRTRLDSIRQRDMPEIYIESNKKLIISETITLHLRVFESCSRMTFSMTYRPYRYKWERPSSTKSKSPYILPKEKLSNNTPRWYPFHRYTRPEVQPKRTSQINPNILKKTCHCL